MGDDLTPPKPSEVFDKCCSFYLSIGMSAAEYWEGDSLLPKYYREAFKMRQERENEVAWLHGLYVYDAIMSALTHLDPKKSSHKDYASKPYSPNSEKNEKERVIEAQAQAEVWMKSWVAATQKQFKE